MTLNPNVRPGAEYDLSLLFTRFNQETWNYEKDILDFYKINKKKKTVFFGTTVGAMEFLDERSPVRQEIINQLLALKKHYNIILRPHPLLGAETLAILRKNFILAPFSQYVSFVPFYSVSDIVVGSVGAALMSATSHPKLPIVLLRPTKTWDGSVELDKTAHVNEGLVLGHTTAVVQTEKNLNLKHAIETAFDHNDQKQEEARKKYFHYWFGCIDGYENYRIILRILDKNKIPISDLLSAYKKFPIFQEKPLCPDIWQ